MLAGSQKVNSVWKVIFSQGEDHVDIRVLN